MPIWESQLGGGGGGGAGEANTASNVGGGAGLAKDKVGADLRFKSLLAGTNITLTPAADTVTITAADGGGTADINALVNGRFAFWEQYGTNQNGLNTTRTVCDFWRLTPGAGEVFTAQQLITDGVSRLRLTRTTAGSAATVLMQRVSGVKTLAGQSVAVHIRGRASAALTPTVHLVQEFGSGGSSDVIVAAQNLALTTSDADTVLTFAVPSLAGKTIGSGDYLALFITLPHNHGAQWYEFDSVALVRSGSAVVWRDESEEMTQCWRRFCKTYDRGVVPGAITGIGALYAYSAPTWYQIDSLLARWQFAVEMDGIPTIVGYRPNTGEMNQWQHAGTNPGPAVAVRSISRRGVTVGHGWASGFASSSGELHLTAAFEP